MTSRISIKCSYSSRQTWKKTFWYFGWSPIHKGKETKKLWSTQYDLHRSGTILTNLLVLKKYYRHKHKPGKWSGKILLHRKSEEIQPLTMRRAPPQCNKQRQLGWVYILRQMSFEIGRRKSHYSKYYSAVPIHFL